MEQIVWGIGTTTLYGLLIVFVAVLAYLIWKRRAEG
mgnify:CR=1 FL=1